MASDIDWQDKARQWMALYERESTEHARVGSEIARLTAEVGRLERELGDYQRQLLLSVQQRDRAVDGADQAFRERDALAAELATLRGFKAGVEETAAYARAEYEQMRRQRDEACRREAALREALEGIARKLDVAHLGFDRDGVPYARITAIGDMARAALAAAVGDA